MLIEFSVTNYRSIYQRQTLSMAAATADSNLQKSNTLDAGASGVPRLVRSAVLYGPNASGKSSLVAALHFLEQLVLGSHRHQLGDPIDVTPFKLTPQSRLEDSKFEITFVEQGVRYDYGVRCNARRITEEWLFAYPKGRAQKWFHRIWNTHGNQDSYKFSARFAGDRKRQEWADETLENALYFSKAVQNKHKQLALVFNWFKDCLRIIPNPQDLNPGYTVDLCLDDEKNRKLVMTFMAEADLSITDIRLKESAFSIEDLPKKMPAPVRNAIAKTVGDRKISITFAHQDTMGESVEFAKNEESNGTQALFALAGPWLDVIQSDRVLVVDELDTSLHSMLVQHLVKRLHSEARKGQLIFTTHNTTLLSQKTMRRDQVWFMEKDRQHKTSQLYPLSDFSPRSNEAIERGYLNGRYGGIPFLKTLDFYR